MKSRKKKGVAIVTALIFMTIIIAVTGLLFALMASLTSKNIIQKNKLKRFVTLQQIKNDFIDNGFIDAEYEYDVQIFNNSNATQSGVQAVVVKKDNVESSIDLIYYVVYDFDNQKVVAEQTENFYLTIKNIDNVDFYYLANLVKYKEV